MVVVTGHRHDSSQYTQYIQYTTAAVSLGLGHYMEVFFFCYGGYEAMKNNGFNLIQRSVADIQMASKGG